MISGQQPQSATDSDAGKPSTPSSDLSSAESQTVLRDQVVENAEANRLARLLGTESVERTLRSEDRAFDRYMNGDRADGADQMPNQVRVISTGNVTVNQPQNESPAPEPEPSRRASTLLPLALGTVLGAGTMGLAAAGLYNALRPDPAPETKRPPVEAVIDIEMPISDLQVKGQDP